MDRRTLLRAAAAAAGSFVAAPAFLRGRYQLFAQSAREYSARTVRLMTESPVVDMLCQFAFPDYREEGTPRAEQWLKDPRAFTEADYIRFRDSGVKVLALGRGANSYEGALRFMAEWNGFIAGRSEWFYRVDNATDLGRVRADGKIGIMITTQNSEHFRNVADVETFHQLGQRVSQLTYNFQNRLGAGFLENRDGGLTVFGGEVMKKMEEVGMVVDLSHCADTTTMDGIAAATRTPIFTHATARALLPDCRRCKTDEMIRGLAAKGGVMGIAFVRFMIRPAPPVTVEHVADHVEHVIRLVGAEHVGIGSDLDMDGRGNPIPRSGPTGISQQPNFERYNPYFADDGGVQVDGLAHPKRLFDLTETLVRRRHSDETIRLVLGGSWARALTANWT